MMPIPHKVAENVTTESVVNLVTTRSSGLLITVSGQRDFALGSCVGRAMTLTLRPPAAWWLRFLAMNVSSADGPGARGSAGVRTPSPAGDRPDADVLELDPAEQLAAITRRHADAVYRVALSVTRDHDLAEDVAQDALLKAWQALPSYRGDAPLKNWLLRITHNAAVSALRRQRDVHYDPSDLPEQPVADYRSLERQVEGRVSLAAFEAALEGLDDLSRSIVVLREIEGLSYQEIAEVLEIPLPTVKTRLLRARRLLATALEGWRP